MTRRLVMGTAGHIDHGKTSLIKLLTGVDCDRLPEEKARGITIELGFTHLTLPSGETIGVVDVPGHERFVRTMVAGAGGIDFVLLVVAADEGVMPQTREHLAICRLLDIRHGLVALTKADLADTEMLALASEDVRELLKGTFLDDAPLVPVSAVSGRGQAELLDAIAATARQSPQKSDSGIFRLPIDRVFTIKGFGTVVTGTCIGGKIAVGDEVEILPAGRRTRVRTLQVHGQSVPTAFAGQRTAVNLHGLEVADVDRGAMLAAPDALTPSWMLDVDIEMTRDAPRPLKRRSLVRVHGYTREVMARVVPLNGDTLEPGRGGKAQLRLTEPLVALPGDRFVLRSYSPMTTVGGGLVLNSQPRKHRAPFDDALADLEILRTGDLAARLGVFFRQAGRRGLELRRVAPLLGVGEKTLRDDYQKLLSQRRLVRIDAETESAVAAEAFEEIKRNLLDYLAAYHRDQPTEPGVSRAELLSRPAKGADAKVMGKALAALVGENQVALEGGLARRTGHVVAAGDRLQETLDRLFGLAQQAGVAALTYKEMRDQFEDRELFEQALVMLTRDKRLARVGDALYYEAGALVKAEAMLAGYLAEHGEIDAQGMKTLFDLSRKWTIPLGEYFDAKRVTLRVGDKRVLRRKG